LYLVCHSMSNAPAPLDETGIQWIRETVSKQGSAAAESLSLDAASLSSKARLLASLGQRLASVSELRQEALEVIDQAISVQKRALVLAYDDPDVWIVLAALYSCSASIQKADPRAELLFHASGLCLSHASKLASNSPSSSKSAHTSAELLKGFASRALLLYRANNRVDEARLLDRNSATCAVLKILQQDPTSAHGWMLLATLRADWISKNPLGPDETAMERFSAVASAFHEANSCGAGMLAIRGEAFALSQSFKALSSSSTHQRDPNEVNVQAFYIVSLCERCKVRCDSEIESHIQSHLDAYNTLKRGEIANALQQQQQQSNHGASSFVGSTLQRLIHTSPQFADEDVWTLFRNFRRERLETL